VSLRYSQPSRRKLAFVAVDTARQPLQVGKPQQAGQQGQGDDAEQISTWNRAVLAELAA